MLDKMRELVLEYRDEFGLLPARKMARDQMLEEALSNLTELDLTTSEKVDRIITVLKLMNMKVD
jgi:hypothetical protein